jgi:hypothetical protein
VAFLKDNIKVLKSTENPDAIKFLELIKYDYTISSLISDVKGRTEFTSNGVGNRFL